MKKVHLLVLACGIFVSTFAQPEISDKWILTADEKIKKGFGRLDMNFPDSIYWWIIIYDQSDKMVKSFYPINKIKSFSFAPGLYRILLSNAAVENVPIKAGHATRLKSGVANIELGPYWQLYDEAKENFFTSSSLLGGTAYHEFETARKKMANVGSLKVLKLALPVGNYQLKEGENYSAIDVTDESRDIKATPVTKGNFEKWVISEPDSVLTEGKGRLVIPFPNYEESMEWGSSYGKIVIVYPNQPNYAVYRDSIYIKDLDPGYYRILYDGIILESVPIIGAKETRLKMGTIGTKYIAWTLYSDSGKQYSAYYPAGNYASDENNSSHLLVPGKTKVVLPVGSYLIGSPDPDTYLYQIYRKIEIKDSTWFDIEPIFNLPPDITYTYVTTKLSNNPTGLGKLNIDFPKDAYWTVVISGEHKGIPVKSYSNAPGENPIGKNVLMKNVTLQDGKYDIGLSNYTIKNVRIYKNYETRLKTGILNITSPGTWSLYTVTSDMVTPNQYETLISSGNQPRKIILPVCANGQYKLVLNGQSKFFSISDGKIVAY